MSHMIVFATTGDSGGPDDGSGVGHGRVEHGHWVHLNWILPLSHSDQTQYEQYAVMLQWVSGIIQNKMRHCPTTQRLFSLCVETQHGITMQQDALGILAMCIHTETSWPNKIIQSLKTHNKKLF